MRKDIHIFQIVIYPFEVNLSVNNMAQVLE